MPIKKYSADADNVITNTFKSQESTTRATGSNAGFADILEVYSLYGRKLISTIASAEMTRTLIKFPISDMITDRSNGVIPASGSTTFKLKLYNAKHFYSLPFGYDIQVAAVSASWEEGYGMDLESYADLTQDGIGSNWMMRIGSEVKEITKIVFSDATKSNYGAGSGVKYFIIYNDAIAYNFWFNDGVGDSAPSADGTEIEVDIQGWSSSTAGVASAFKEIVAARDEFSANIIGSTVYVTASTGGPATHSLSSVADWTSLALTVEQSGSNATPWTKAGGDYHTDASSSFTQTFNNGTQNLDIDITPLVEQWIDSDNNVLGSKDNYGLIIKVAEAYEPYYSSSAGVDADGVLHHTGGVKRSYFTKMFFGRGSEFFYKRPSIEAQFDDSIQDDRNKFYISSSLKQSYAENLNRLYFFNNHAGSLIDIAGSIDQYPTASFYYSSGSVPEGSARGFLDNTGSAVTVLTASRASTGSYYIDAAVTKSVTTSTYPYLVDVWSYGGEEILTGSAITPVANNPVHNPVKSNYIIAMPGLQPEYYHKQTARLRLYARDKNWSPNIYTKSKLKPESTTIISGSYRILRSVDDYEVQSYGTGSVKYSALSYDGAGNYFDLNMENFEIGYQYIIRYAFYDGYTQTYVEQPHEFKFRVVD